MNEIQATPVVIDDMGRIVIDDPYNIEEPAGGYEKALRLFREAVNADMKDEEVVIVMSRVYGAEPQ